MTIPRPGPLFHASETRPAFTSGVTSSSKLRMAMSASNPAAMARDWAPEPLYDSSNRTSRPVSAFHLAAKAGRRASCRTSRTTE